MSIGPTLVILFTLAWMIALAYFLGRIFHRAARSRAHRQQLLQSGAEGTAAVLSVDTTGPYYGHTPHLRFRLQVRASDGAEFESTAVGFFRQIDYPRYQPGCTVEIRYDPADPSTVAVVGDRLTK